MVKKLLKVRPPLVRVETTVERSIKTLYQTEINFLGVVECKKNLSAFDNLVQSCCVLPGEV